MCSQFIALLDWRGIAMNFRWLFLVTSSSTSLKLLPFFEVEPVSFMFENPNQENGGTEDQKKEKKGTKDLGVAVFCSHWESKQQSQENQSKRQKLREKEKKRFSQKQNKKLLWQESKCVTVSTYTRFLPQSQPSNDSVRRNFQGFWHFWRKKETKGR